MIQEDKEISKELPWISKLIQWKRLLELIEIFKKQRRNYLKTPRNKKKQNKTFLRILKLPKKLKGIIFKRLKFKESRTK